MIHPKSITLYQVRDPNCTLQNPCWPPDLKMKLSKRTLWRRWCVNLVCLRWGQAPHTPSLGIPPAQHTTTLCLQSYRTADRPGKEGLTSGLIDKGHLQVRNSGVKELQFAYGRRLGFMLRIMQEDGEARPAWPSPWPSVELQASRASSNMCPSPTKTEQCKKAEVLPAYSL